MVHARTPVEKHTYPVVTARTWRKATVVSRPKNREKLATTGNRGRHHEKPLWIGAERSYPGL
jgi:hypothetical protein